MESRNETSFQFANQTNQTNTYQCNMDTNVVLHIHQINHSVALVSFTNESNEKIKIPSGLVVYGYDFQTKEKVVVKPIKQEYVLCWTDDYTIEQNGKIVLDIKNERKWNIIHS
jgi:hypothetical protein